MQGIYNRIILFLNLKLYTPKCIYQITHPGKFNLGYREFVADQSYTAMTMNKQGVRT